MNDMARVELNRKLVNQNGIDLFIWQWDTVSERLATAEKHSTSSPEAVS